jgi:uncharacterized Fe-S cluster-containing protein
MLAHAAHIHEKLGKDASVIFIGPCVAKKAEADRPENQGQVDCVLTFTELAEWFGREGIDLSVCEESHFDEEPEGESRYYPLVGGSMKTASLTTDCLAEDLVSVSGFADIREALENADSRHSMIIEPLFCQQGCINGPAIPVGENAYLKRNSVLNYAGVNHGITPEDVPARVGLRARFNPAGIDETPVTEEQIREVLEKTGKASPEDQLNCGACGYVSCREKAIAVIRGMAELEMCIPHMKRLAEQRTDRIIETSPNGIVITDEHLNIISMNPAFRSFFMCSEAVCGKPISYLMDPDPFERLASGKEGLIETVATHPNYSLICHEILYSLPEEKQFVGIFVNITRMKADKKKLDHLRGQTILQARELLEHQINMAQTIAKFLGESTAESECLLDKLMLMAGDESDSDSEGRYGTQWIKDTYTSK